MKNGGQYINFKEMDVIDKESLYKNIKRYGSISLFPNKSTYNFFRQYLKKINNNPQDFIGKDEKYKQGKTIYILTLYSQEERILIQINENVYVEDFGYAEQSYMYYFEKVDGKIMLSEINAAG